MKVIMHVVFLHKDFILNHQQAHSASPHTIESVLLSVMACMRTENAWLNTTANIHALIQLRRSCAL